MAVGAPSATTCNIKGIRIASAATLARSALGPWRCGTQIQEFRASARSPERRLNPYAGPESGLASPRGEPGSPQRERRRAPARQW